MLRRMAALSAGVHVPQSLCSVLKMPIISWPFARGVDLEIDCHRACFACNAVSGIELVRDAVYLRSEQNRKV